ncbi:hypothetical protein [Paenibacillus sp. LK1]|uniref:hypothetical protein n=1 Tax=Paenibacillus sp. LK1 TaxID=2053014 RepID=UPI000C19C5B5|nr:hypothetical protein [Paenibacillus sp. LK1]PIH59418.1 hypothetical protein CS562_11015 [Paenibacillus sp. LK1]
MNTEITYDSKTNKVSIGSTSSSSGSSSTSNSGSTSTASTDKNNQAEIVKAKYLPADLPLPTDAKIISLIESSVDGGKNKIIFTYTTKETLLAVGASYKSYYQNKDLTQYSKDVQGEGFSIIARKKEKFAVSITGSISTTDKDINEITVVWEDE